jgi:rfaE bifunctional protein kinase chain/domain
VKISKSRLASVVSGFRRKSVAVIGDIIGDEYILGMTSRVSREAPVLILKYDSRSMFLGGASNTANNIVSLGGRAIPVGVVGDDETGGTLLGIYRSGGMDPSLIVRSRRRMTTTKTRFLAGGLNTMKQQVIRIDREDESPLSKRDVARLCDNIVRAIEKADSVLVSDYGFGTINDETIDLISSECRRLHKPLNLDTRFNVFKFRGINCWTPNEPEVEEVSGSTIRTDEDLVRVAGGLMDRIDARHLLATRGKKGMMLFTRGGTPVSIPIYGTDEVADVTGAGDTVIATFTLGMSAGAGAAEAAWLATYAAGTVVMKSGTATVSTAEMLAILGARG